MIDKHNFLKEIDDKVIIGDGAMGTLLQESGITSCPAILSKDSEEYQKVLEIHLLYLRAGSQIIQTNTFSANPIKLRACNLADHISEVNLNAVNAAKDAKDIYLSEKGADENIYIAANIGPTGKLLRPFGDLDYHEATEAFSKQLDILVSSQIDIILIETMMDINEALVAVEAAKKVGGNIAIVCTLTFNESGVTLMGNKAEDAAVILDKAGCAVVGANCSVGSDKMLNVVKKMRDANKDVSLIFQPNAGLPVMKDGQTVYNETPQIFSDNIKSYLKYRPSIIGGCCGSTPGHIRKLKEEISR
jgi:5-methyltetrahydrofolate--homocysteine methyltransferase